jgi:hypothetical protein
MLPPWPSVAWKLTAEPALSKGTNPASIMAATNFGHLCLARASWGVREDAPSICRTKAYESAGRAIFACVPVAGGLGVAVEMVADGVVLGTGAWLLGWFSIISSQRERC